MYGQTHHLRGRLRLRFSHLKNNLSQLTGVIESLRAVAGVSAVEGTPFTGGMLVFYDTAMGDTRQFWDDIEAVLKSHGLHHNPRPLARQTGPAAACRVSGKPSGMAGLLVDKLADKLADKLVEPSAMALLAVLL